MKGEELLARLNTLLYRLDIRNIIKFILNFNDLYKDKSRVLKKIIDNDYPFYAYLKNGDKLEISNFLMAYFYTLYLADLEDLHVTDEFLEFSYNGKKVRFYGWKKGGIFDAFARKDYNFLNVTNKTVIDIGAGIGDTAIYFILGGARRVVAFEPFPKIFYIAQKNIIENNMEDKITLVNAGCGFDGYVSIDENFDSNATSRLVDQKQGLQVPVYSLDTIISKFNVDEDSILKVDCEGCEYELFKNASDNSLLKFIRIQIEYHYGYRILEEKLKKLGFKVKHTPPRFLHNKMIQGYLYALRNN